MAVANRIESNDERVNRALGNIEIGYGEDGAHFRCKECGATSRLEAHIKHSDECETGHILAYRTLY